jgi:formylglycine-generating enzyme required for sulfatase activity
MNRATISLTDRRSLPSEEAHKRAACPGAYLCVNWQSLMVAVVSGLILLCGTGTIRGQIDSGTSEVINTLFHVQRSGTTDHVWLRNGELLKGIVQNDVFTLRTAHGPLALETHRIAGLELLAGRQPLDTVHGVNQDRLSGFIEESWLDVQLSDGSRLKLRRETVHRVLFRIRPGELEDLPRRQSIGLKNGDWLSGRLAGAPFEVRMPDGTLPLVLTEIESITFPDEPDRPARIHLSEGAWIDGHWPKEDITIELDLGPALQVFRAHVAIVHGPDGFRPAASIERLSSGPGKAELWRADSVPRLDTGPFEGMVWIAPGEFMLGSPPEEMDRDLDEGPVTRVTITRGFWMAIHEVTQAEYMTIMGINPSQHTGDTRHPVERVSWRDAMDYCARLVHIREAQGTLPPGYEYRLPTEAEWEYACRADTISRFSFGDDPQGRIIEDYAWFTGNSDSSTHPVGTRKPNPWGLHDMHGNVFEWCLDSASNSHPGRPVRDYRSSVSGSLRIARGGSWLYGAKASRSANRDSYGETTRCSDLGFRVVLAPRDMD